MKKANHFISDLGPKNSRTGLSSLNKTLPPTSFGHADQVYAFSNQHTATEHAMEDVEEIFMDEISGTELRCQLCGRYGRLKI